MINLELEQMKLRLIETQMALLQYQHREVTEKIQTAQSEKPNVMQHESVPEIYP